MELPKIDLSQLRFPETEQLVNMQDRLMMDMVKSITNKRDETIKAAFVKNGLNPNDIEFLKHNIQRVVFNEYDEFDHYYYHFGQPDEIRIISIERTPKMEHDLNNDTYSYGINYTQKYY